MERIDSLYYALSLQQEETSRLQDSISILRDTVGDLQSTVESWVPANSGGTPLWIVLLLVVLAAAIVYLYLRMRGLKEHFTARMRDIEGHFTSQVMMLREEMRREKLLVTKQLTQLQEKKHTDGPELIIVDKRTSSSPSASESSYPAHHEGEDITSPQQHKSEEPPVKSRPQRKVIKYASIQEDAQGGLKIAERVMNDDATKMFIVEMEDDDTKATYTFNPLAEASILSDLQTFRNFTEPFTISGTPLKVVEVEKGQLEKSGKFWLAKSKLKIDFKY